MKIAWKKDSLEPCRDCGSEPYLALGPGLVYRLCFDCLDAAKARGRTPGPRPRDRLVHRVHGWSIPADLILDADELALLPHGEAVETTFLGREPEGYLLERAHEPPAAA